ncbi:zinc-dependent alcohol dehydrogenase family protein [Sodalis ligni]|uniref:NADPH:quinone reductase-like Zn-dependent oxidoreductase n=1 Tax=Sodalis ligni TaxID=2697027 RepID=A0A4R1NBF8_9GAMM|nr:NAD(P)-dependent alcohol dehydrogenase [Sodalis ligni]TCL04633.1 NADPH:quinone reductase-like Zn-dependent oxidoreductase [Sodalis ligni]
MRTYQLQSGAGIGALVQTDLASRPLGPRDVRVRMRAAALNARDLAFARGAFYNPPSHPIVPLVDGCGEVVEIGDEVTRFVVGERVITNYYPRWIDGTITPAKTAVSFGAQLDGTLAEELVTDQEGLVRAPASLDDRAAATLSCAGLTAWHALFGVATLQPGATVLLLGTGGVSIWALQLASAAGLFPIITSSQDDKLERAVSLGARATVNYRSTPEWQKEVIGLTHGLGADLVVEVGGEGTLARSLQASRAGGTVVVIGRVSGGGGVSIEPGALIGGAKRLTGITTGSRAMLEDLVRFVDSAAITPAIDKVFGFGEARDAYDYVAHGQHFGKTVIDFSQ